MKYSLKDFKRAADRHIGDMEPSAGGRARLTRQVNHKPSPMSWLGWAAVVAACLIVVALLNLPAPRMHDSPDDGRPLTGVVPLGTERPLNTPNPTIADAMLTEPDRSLSTPSHTLADVMPTGLDLSLNTPSPTMTDAMPTEPDRSLSTPNPTMADAMPTELDQSLSTPNPTIADAMPTEPDRSLSTPNPTMADAMPTDLDRSLSTPNPTLTAIITSASYASAAPSPSPAPAATNSLSPSATPAASPSAARRLTARDSALLCKRDDECFVGYDYAGRAYIIKDLLQVFDENYYAYSVDFSDEYFLTLEEVLATDEGRAYYGVDSPDDVTSYFYQALWPRPEVVTWLPDCSPSNWISYYTELDVGVVQSLRQLSNDGMSRFGLASADGLITPAECVDIFGFTTDDVTVASVPALDGYSASAYRSYGVLNARGEWVRQPVAGELETLYADLAGNGGSVPVYYMLRTYAELELKYDEATGAEYIDYDYGPTLIMDLSGNVLMTVDEFGYMFINTLTDAPIPYKDIETGLWGYVDMDLNIVIQPQYLSAQNFGGGLAAVEVAVEPSPETGNYSTLYGFIDETGELVIEPQYALVMSGFTDEGGNARVWLPDDDTVQHTIDRNGNDVSNPLSLTWQRLFAMRERVPLVPRLSTWALLILLAMTISWKRLRGYPDGYGAQNKRISAGFGGYMGFMLMYAALDVGMQSALPGLMLFSSATGYEWTAYALVLGTAVLGGAIYGWAARARCRTRMGLALSCLTAVALPVAARWLMGMCTRMDIDAALALALGMAAGALTSADRDDEPVSFKYRLICMVLSAALTFGPLALDSQDLTPRRWPAAAALGEVELTLTPLSDPASLDYVRARADDSSLDDEYLSMVYGEDWRAQLDALLAEPEGYALLTLDIPLYNPYLRAQSVAAYAYLTPDPEADAACSSAYLESAYEIMDYAPHELAPLTSQTASVMYLVRVGDTPLDEWLNGLKACCRIQAGVY